jgi:hypothetical protein
VDADGARRKHFGSGNFTIDWDKAATLPERDDNAGKGVFTYSREAADAPQVSVVVKFTQVVDREHPGHFLDADYSFKATRGTGGEFSFGVDQNMDANPSLERLTVMSRWQQGGAGRSDVKLSGGDLGAGAFTASECWDTNFIARYSTAAYPGAPAGYGVEAEDCAFTSAVYASAAP